MFSYVLLSNSTDEILGFLQIFSLVFHKSIKYIRTCKARLLQNTKSFATKLNFSIQLVIVNEKSHFNVSFHNHAFVLLF